MKKKQIWPFNLISRIIMIKLQQIFKKAKNHVWTTFMDTVYPKKLRRPYNRYMRDTKPYYPWNPGFANEYQNKRNECIENDYRIPFKDNKNFNTRFEDHYFRKDDEYPDLKIQSVSKEEIKKKLEQFKNEFGEKEMNQILDGLMENLGSVNDPLYKDFVESIANNDDEKLKQSLRNIWNYKDNEK